MPSFLDALVPFVETCDIIGIPYYIGGSVACIAHGMPRTTLDVDVVADIQPIHVPVFVERLQGMYYIQAADIHDAIAHYSSFNMIHFVSIIKIDVFVAPQRPFDQMKARRAQYRQLSVSNAREFRITSPEDIILQKLEWYALGNQVSERQWRDVNGVLRVQGNVLDFAYMRYWAVELQIVDLLEQALVEAHVG